MKPISLYIKNFKCFDEVNLDFTEANSYCICGSSKNNQNESNGTGKSSLLEAFKFVLYGEYDGKNINNLIRDGQDSLKVSLVFDLNKVFKVERVRTKKLSFLSLFEKNEDGSWKSISGKTQPETEIKLQEIIKANYTAFCNYIFFSKKDNKQLSLARTPSERRKILKEILDLLIYSDIEKMIKEDLSEINKQIIVNNASIEVLGNPQNKIEQLQALINSHELMIEKKINERKNCDLKLNELIDKINNLQSQINPNSHLQSSLQDLKNKKRDTQLTLNNSNKTLAAKQKEYEIAKKNFDEKNLQNQKYKEELENLKKKKCRDQSLIISEIHKNHSDLINLKSEILSLEERLSSLNTPVPDGEICPACRQVLTQEHRLQCKMDLMHQINVISTEIKSKNILVSNIEILQKSLEDELKEVNDVKKTIESLTEKIESKKEELKNLHSVGKQIVQMIDKVKNDNDYYQKNIEELSNKEIEIQNLLNPSQIELKEKEIVKFKEEFQKYQEKSVEILQDYSKIEAEISFYKKEIKREEDNLIKWELLHKKNIELYSQKEISLFGLESAKPGGIPTWIIHGLLNTFQCELSQATKELRPEMDVKILIHPNESDSEEEDTFDFEYKIYNKKVDQYHLSEGQEFTSSWGFRRGLGALLEKSLGYKFNFLLLDEIDQALDKKTLNLLIDILLRLQNEYKIFIISHNEWVKSKFKHHIQVEYDPINGSTAKIVTV